jgi:hypothetical protein
MVIPARLRAGVAFNVGDSWTLLGQTNCITEAEAELTLTYSLRPLLVIPFFDEGK